MWEVLCGIRESVSEWYGGVFEQSWELEVWELPHTSS